MFIVRSEGYSFQAHYNNKEDDCTECAMYVDLMFVNDDETLMYLFDSREKQCLAIDLEGETKSCIREFFDRIIRSMQNPIENNAQNSLDYIYLPFYVTEISGAVTEKWLKIFGGE